MAGRTALITGAAGQDGQLLSQRLLDAGYRVVGLVRPGGDAAIDGPLRAVTYLAIDLLDMSAVRTLLERWQPDELYHLAAFHHSSQQRSVGAALASKDAMVSINFLATKTLAFALLELGLPCHLVFASSSQMYSAQEHDLEIDERSPRRPSTFYGHVKSWSMDLLGFLRRESALRASSAILFNHESPLRGLQFVTRKVTRAAAAARLGLAAPPLELQNVGARVDWSAARDVVRALHLMALAPEAADHVIGSGETHSVSELLETAFRHVGLDWRRHARYAEDRPLPALRACPQALQQRLGWRREVGFEAMLAEMVDHDIALAASA